MNTPDADNLLSDHSVVWRLTRNFCHTRSDLQQLAHDVEPDYQEYWEVDRHSLGCVRNCGVRVQRST